MSTQILVAVQDLAGYQATHAGLAAGAEDPERRVRDLRAEHPDVVSRGSRECLARICASTAGTSSTIAGS